MARAWRERRRKIRQREAIERQEARAARTNTEQLRLIKTRPGNSHKERARLAR